MGLAAFGGGTLRDVLLDRRPFFWVAQPTWLWILIALGVAAILFLRTGHFEFTERAIQWPDALGLGLFTASGTQLALAQDLPPIVAVLMGVVSATAAACCATSSATRSPPLARPASLCRVRPSRAAGSTCWTVHLQLAPDLAFLFAALTATACGPWRWSPAMSCRRAAVRTRAIGLAASARQHEPARSPQAPHAPTAAARGRPYWSGRTTTRAPLPVDPPRRSKMSGPFFRSGQKTFS
jgi:hypothetical protein